jgi:hypothetical protein
VVVGFADGHLQHARERPRVTHLLFTQFRRKRAVRHSLSDSALGILPQTTADNGAGLTMRLTRIGVLFCRMSRKTCSTAAGNLVHFFAHLDSLRGHS